MIRTPWEQAYSDMMGLLSKKSEWSGCYPSDCYDYQSTCGANNKILTTYYVAVHNGLLMDASQFTKNQVDKQDPNTKVLFAISKSQTQRRWKCNVFLLFLYALKVKTIWAGAPLDLGNAKTRFLLFLRTNLSYNAALLMSRKPLEVL